MGSKNRCAICDGIVRLRYNPMKEWGINGVLCGECYSKKLDQHYPGDHPRVNRDLD